MKSIVQFFSLAIIISSLTACQNDFDVKADYKETLILYGVLRADTGTQILKINKSFLGNGDARDYAKISDSINYDKTLDAYIVRYSGGVATSDKYPLRDSLVYANSSNFAAYQKLYIADFTPKQDGQSEYRFVANHKGNSFTSSTLMPGKHSVTRPNPNYSVTMYKGADKFADIEVQIRLLDQIRAAKKYDIVTRFEYTEQYQNGLSRQRYYDKIVTMDRSDVTDSGYLNALAINSGDFLISLAAYMRQNSENEAGVPVSSRIYQTKTSFQVLVTSYNEELYNYITINQQSTSIAQDKPEYTNVNNGLGIFSAKYTTKTQYELEGNTINYINDPSGPFVGLNIISQ